MCVFIIDITTILVSETLVCVWYILVKVTTIPDLIQRGFEHTTLGLEVLASYTDINLDPRNVSINSNLFQ